MRTNPFAFEFSAQLQAATTKVAVAVNKAKEKWIENCLRIVLPDVTVDNAKEGKDWRHFTDLCKTEGIHLEEVFGDTGIAPWNNGFTRFMIGTTELSRFVVGPRFAISIHGIGAL